LPPGLVLFPLVGSFSGSSAAAAATSFRHERKHEAPPHSSPRSDCSRRVPFAPAQSTAQALHSISCSNGGCSITIRASLQSCIPFRPSFPAGASSIPAPSKWWHGASRRSCSGDGRKGISSETRKFKLTKILAEEPGSLIGRSAESPRGRALTWNRQTPLPLRSH
jgi:hypothetical protein